MKRLPSLDNKLIYYDNYSTAVFFGQPFFQKKRKLFVKFPCSFLCKTNKEFAISYFVLLFPQIFSTKIGESNFCGKFSDYIVANFTEIAFFGSKFGIFCCYFLPI